MSRMQKFVFRSSKPIRLSTEEEMKEVEEMLDMLEEYGVVCITDSSKTNVNIMEEIRQNPGGIWEFNGDIFFEEFRRRLMNGEYDRKRNLYMFLVAGASL